MRATSEMVLGPTVVPARAAHSTVAALCVALCLIRVTPWYVSRLNDGNDEPYGLIALVAALCFLWRERGEWSKRSTPMAALLLGALTVWLPQLPPLASATAAVIVVALAARTRNLAVTGLLALSLPVMASLQFYAGFPLRCLTALGAEALLRLSGVSCERSGATLSAPDGLVGVDAPCSGLRMWWTACALALALMARMRMAPPGVILGLLVTTLLVILGNTLRAALLFFPESGRVHWPEWAHEGVGLAIFALCAWALIAALDRLDPGAEARPAWFKLPARCPSRKSLAVAVAGVLAALAIGVWALRNERPSFAAALPSLPTNFEGAELVPSQLSPSEEAFAKGFPGRLSVFVQGDRQIIWRETLRPTRMLHSSLDCLRAAGCSVKEKPIFTDAAGVRWGAAEAFGDFWDSGKRHVRERIVDPSGQSWTDVSSWWWAATLGKTQGPWTAITVIEP